MIKYLSGHDANMKYYMFHMFQQGNKEILGINLSMRRHLSKRDPLKVKIKNKFNNH